MKTTNKIALIFALIWIIAKMIIFNLGYSSEWFNFTALLNLLFLLLVIFVVLHYHKQKQQTEFLSDLKEAVKGGSVYTLILVVFFFLYFKYIDPGFFEERMEILGALSPEELSFEELKEMDPVKMQNISEDDFYAKEKETRELFSSPFFNATIMLAGMMITTFIYSFFATVFSRKILTRLR